MNLEDKNNIVNQVRDLLMNEGLSQEEAVEAILDADVIHMIHWDDMYEIGRTAEDYAAEAYEFWKAKQD